MKVRASLLAVFLAAALVASNVAVAHADDYLIVRVISLNHVEGYGFYAEVLSAGQHFEIQVDQDFWNALDVGDTLVQSGDRWSLLSKGNNLNLINR